MSEKKSENWEDYVELNGDCPETIFKMANTPWEKAVALEFLSNHKDREIIKEKLAMQGKLLWGILGLTALAVLAQFIQTYLIPLI